MKISVRRIASMQYFLILFLIAFPLISVAQEQEAVSLLGTPLLRPVFDQKTATDFENKLAVAKAAFEKNPRDLDSIIWLGRRTAYLGRYREAISIYTRGLEIYPDEPKLYRHRGHRYLSVRKIDLAIADFERAAQLIAGRPDEIEPDGLPNAKNIPTSTLHTNIYYHLGLAFYLKQDFTKAEKAYLKCKEFSKNDDMLVALSHWRYMTLRRQGKNAEAERLLEPIEEKMNIIEDFDYHALTLMYKGLKSATELEEQQKKSEGISGPTLAYGLANWNFYNGKEEKAIEIFRRIIGNTKEWGAFGYLAAEAELANIKQ